MPKEKNFTQAAFKEKVKNDIDEIYVLIADETNISVDGEPLAVYLARTGNHGLIEKILEKFKTFPNVNAESAGKTAFYWAIEQEDYKIIKLLLQARADIYQIIPDNKLTVYEMASRNPHVKAIFESKKVDFKKHKVKEQNDATRQDIYLKIRNLLLKEPNKAEAYLLSTENNVIDAKIDEVELDNGDRHRLLTDSDDACLFLKVREQIKAILNSSSAASSKNTQFFIAPRAIDTHANESLREKLKNILEGKSDDVQAEDMSNNVFTFIVKTMLFKFLNKNDNKIDIIRRYLEKTKLDLNLPLVETEGKNFLCLAIEKNNWELVNLFIAKGAKLDSLCDMGSGLNGEAFIRQELPSKLDSLPDRQKDAAIRLLSNLIESHVKGRIANATPQTAEQEDHRESHVRPGFF